MSRRIVFWVVLAAAAWVLATHVPDVLNLAATIRSGSIVWISVAALLQVGYYLCYVATFREAFRASGIKRTLRNLAPVVFGSIFVNVVAPSGGTAGPALVVDDAVRRGESGARATTAMVLTDLADFAGFGVIMIGGLLYLGILHRLTGYEIVAAAVFVGLVAALGGALIAGAVRPRLLERLLGLAEDTLIWLRGTAQRLTRGTRPALSRTGWAERTAGEFAETARAVAGRPSGLARAWGVALLGHTVDLVSLFAIGYAFGWRSPGSIVAAYAVGVLLWIVSIVPQGIGVVEATMALVLTSFGAAAGPATAIALTFRGLSFWLPFAIGGLLLRRVESFRSHHDESTGRLTVAVAGLLVSLAGIANILIALRPHSHAAARVASRIPAAMPLQVQTGHLAAALTGAALLLTARALWRRKRAAWMLTVGLLSVSALTHMFHGRTYSIAIASAAVAVWLVSERAEFHARSDAPSIRQGLRTLAAAFALTLAYGTLGFFLLDRHFSVNFGLGAAVRQTVVMFTQFTNPGLEPTTGFGRYFAGSIYAVAALSFAYALVMLLRPVLVRRPSSAEELARATAIVKEWGRSALARTAVMPDKVFWFSEGGSFIAYVVRGGVAVTLGDPIGPPEDLGASVVAFRALAETNGWIPAFYQTLPEGIDAYKAAGFELVRIGHEAVVNVHEFSLAGKSHKTIRNRVNRLEQDGYRAQLLPAPQSPEAMRELRAVSDAWLAETKGTEKRFSLGWFDDDYIRGCDVMAVVGPLGDIEAFANLMPEYRLNEGTIDLMRHLPDAPSGTMDFLFVRLIEWCRDHGYESFNLGLSALAGIGEEADDPVVEKAMRLAYLYANSFYSFTGLHEYKDKFDPEWQPRYLVYPDTAALPRIVWAVVIANSGDSPVKGYMRSVLKLTPRELAADSPHEAPADDDAVDDPR